MNIVPLTALATCLLLPTSKGFQYEIVRAETALPATTYASVHFAGLGACRQIGDELGLIKLIRRVLPEVNAKLLPPEASRAATEIQRGIAQMDRQLAKMGVNRAILGLLLRGPMAFGVSRPIFHNGSLMPSMALAIDISALSGGKERMAEMIVQAIGQAGGGRMQHSEEDVAGNALHLFDGKNQDDAIAIGMTERYLIVSNSSGYARDCIRAAVGEMPSLVTDVGLQRALARLGNDELLSVYFNTNLLMGWVERFLPYEVDAVTDALGCRDVDGIYLAIGAGDDRSKEILHVGIRGSDTGLVRSLLVPATHRAVRMCPKDTVLYATSRIDPRGMLDAVERLVESLPAAIRKEALSGLRGADRDLQKMRQILDVFGPELTIAIPMIGVQGMIPQGLVFLESDHPDQAMAMLIDIAKQQGMQFKIANYRGEEIAYTSTMAGNVKLTPAITIHDGMVIVASDMRALKAAISRGEQDRRNLTHSDSFVETIERVNMATGMINLRLGDNVGKIWGMVLPMAEGFLARQEKVQLSPEILPDADEVREILNDVLLSVSADDDGIVIAAEQPFGLGLALASLGYGLDWFLSTEDIDLSRFIGTMATSSKPTTKKIF